MSSDNEKIFLVKWVDSMSNPGWQYSEDCKAKIVECQTVGFLVDENEVGICLALNRGLTEGTKPFGDIVTIPKVAIIQKVVLYELG